MQNQAFTVGIGRSKWIGGIAAGAVAGLAAGQQADGNIVHTTVDAVINSANSSYTVDFRNDGNGELKIQYDTTMGLVANKNISAGPFYLPGATAGQIKAMNFGDTISPGGLAPFVALVNTNALLDDGAGNGEFAASAGEKYIGINLNDGSAAWVGFQVFNDGSLAGMSGEVYDFAYQTDNTQSILAGVPEPSSAALVAMGAVGLAAYRRRGKSVS
jgi:hypothetical protein